MVVVAILFFLVRSLYTLHNFDLQRYHSDTIICLSVDYFRVDEFDWSINTSFQAVHGSIAYAKPSPNQAEVCPRYQRPNTFFVVGHMGGGNWDTQCENTLKATREAFVLLNICFNN